MSADRTYLPVPSVVSSVIVRLLDGWTPTAPALGRAARLEWAGSDVTDSTGEVRIREDVLEIEWRGNGIPLAFRQDEYKRFHNSPFRGVLDAGWRFSAESGMFGETEALEGHYWQADDPDQSPVLWVAKVGGVLRDRDLEAPGNLRALRTRASTRHVTWGHRFFGNYTYYIVPQVQADGAKAWFIVIDTGADGPPTRRPTFQDVLALQFVLGRGLFFDLIYGLDAASSVVALVGGRHGRDHGRRPQIAVPVPFASSEEHWPGQFFEAISKKYREHPELRLYIALTFYLDSLTSIHVEGRYLALHVALEAFAYWYLEQDEGEEAPLVDKAKWAAWLKDTRPAIMDLATAGMGEALFTKITSVAARRASSLVVEEAFKRLGLELLPEMATELEVGRGRIVHTAAMFPETQAQLDAYLKPIALVRTMLIALVARVVGYRGAIVGWERPGQTADPEWWPVDPACREAALCRFDVQRPSESKGPST